MSDYANSSVGSEAVPVKVNRVFDSCSDKDCITGVRVALTSSVPPSATIIKPKCITVCDVCMNVEPIPFNKGFYSVDITFTFDVQLLAYDKACSTPTSLYGKASVSKNCILYGSETSTKTFSSDGSVTGTDGNCCNTINPPTALVQVVSPLILESKITSCKPCECMCSRSESTSESSGNPSGRDVVLTVGLFYVVELVRPVTVMVQTYPYTIPQKECCSETDSPCEVFDKIRFPVEEFSPQKPSESRNTGGKKCGCGCGVSAETFNPQPLTDDIEEE